MSAYVKLEGFHWRYPSFSGSEDNPWVLNGVDLEIERNEFFGITGPSGAGKTTTCKAILGIIPHGVKIPFRMYDHHLRGRVWVGSELVTGVDPAGGVVEGRPRGQLLGKGVTCPAAGMVMQDPETQFLRMSLLHEVSFGLQLLKLPKPEIESRVREALEMVGLGFLVDDAEYIHPDDLSGGQKQRVAIASFLAMRPDLLILDEPTSDLDPRGKREVIETVSLLSRRHNMTIVLVEQDPEILCRFCDRIALVDEGRVRLVDEAKQFYRHVATLDDCGVYRFAVSRIAHQTHLRRDGEVPISLEESLSCFPSDLDFAVQASVPQPTSEVIVEAEGVEFAYEDGTQALRGVELKVHQGEILALLGTNGSGKTTLAKILNGIYKPTGGTVRVLGEDIRRRRVRTQLPRYVGYVFQNPDHQIFTRKVGDEVAYGLKNLGITKDELDGRIYRALQAVGLEDKANEDPLFLGKGQRQRLAVASILAMQPRMIIVDEPTTGQDFRMVSSIMKLLEELQRLGNTVLIITHDMTLVADYCHRVVALRNGRVVFNGTPRQLFSDEVALAATQLCAPQAIQLSVKMRETNRNFPLLANSDEWIKALEAYRLARPREPRL